MDSGTHRPPGWLYTPATSSHSHLRALRNGAGGPGGHSGLNKPPRTREPNFSSKEAPGPGPWDMWQPK